MHIINKITKESILKWFVIGLVFLVTFPFFQPDYGMGLDASYVWGLNWLFANDYQTLINLSYPFGPLAFLKIPAAIGHNLLFFLLFYSILKISFIFLLFNLSETFHLSFKPAIPIALIVCFFTNIDFLLIGSCLILNVLFYKQHKSLYLYMSAVLGLIGLFIKVSIGISALSIVFISLLIDYYYNRNIVKSLKQTGISAALGIGIGLVIFQGFVPLFRFLWGAVKLSGGYGETLSLHPPNNWILISLFLVLILSFPFWNKNKDVRIACLLALFPFFASWKHSFIRQDIPHYTIIIYFLIVFWGIILLLSKEKRLITLIVGGCTVLLLYANMRTLPMYRGISREIVGINNFINVLDYQDFKQRIFTLSEKNIAPNKLSETQRQLIGDQTVDVYSWEHSYIAANGLNWKPRRTVEWGASTSQWASMEASKNYLLHDNSPEFLIFHIQKGRYNNYLSSLDERYILNDEPLVMYNIFNHYQLREKTDKFLIFAKDTVGHFENPTLETLQSIQFNEWIEVSESNHEIVRLKVFSKNTLWGSIRKSLYKEEEYYIDYMLKDGNIHTFRYAPTTAVDGLWCYPFIREPQSDIIEPDVVKVRLRNSNPRCISSSVTVQFEKIKLKTNYIDTTTSPINNFLFKKTKQNEDASVIKYYFQDFENMDNTVYNISNLSSKPAGHSNVVEKNDYSYTYEINLDSIWQQTDANHLNIESNVEILNYSPNAGLVISVEGSRDDFWENVYLTRAIHDDIWHYAYQHKKINRDSHAKGMLKIYVFNFGDKDMYVDDFRIIIKEIF